LMDMDRQLLNRGAAQVRMDQPPVVVGML